MSIYGDIILDHYHNPRNYKTISQKTHAVEVKNPLCGDELTMEAIIKGGKLIDIGFSGQGCAISLASASLLTEFVKDTPVEELKGITPEDVVGLLHVELSPNRLKCALLSLEALKKILSQ
ncbi:iron-sulfur cluster assembly scaffold protein [Candidatus Woesebacteria bacterium]|nr:iron-sulfur cluster assembly scaffold protein [Candidatus Woesebacteria bacterium]